MQDFGASPAALRLITSTSNVALANPEQQIFDAMIDGWRNQQLSRGLRDQTIRIRAATVVRFRDFMDDLLGITPASADAWSRLASGDWSDYPKIRSASD